MGRSQLRVRMPVRSALLMPTGQKRKHCLAQGASAEWMPGTVLGCIPGRDLHAADGLVASVHVTATRPAASTALRLIDRPQHSGSPA